MAPSTRSSTGAFPSGARKRVAESDDEPIPDASSASAQEHPKTRKRAKIAQDDAEVKASKPVARASRQRVRGLLKALPDMPLDVLEEIFILCDPATLVGISRTSKSFCRLLQSTAFAYVWREAFAHNADIPSAPEGWSLVKWAGLLFGERCCQACLCPKVDAVSFGILKRLCEQCIRTTMMQCIDGKLFEGLSSWSMATLIPTATIRIQERYKTRYGDPVFTNLVFAYQSDMNTLVQNLLDGRQSGDQERRNYLRERRQLFEGRSEHASRAEKWQRARLDREAQTIETARNVRRAELQNAKDSRRKEIMKRIQSEGYDPKLDMSGVLKLKGINLAQPLTDDDWVHLWTSMEPLLQTNKEKRLAERSAEQLNDRHTFAEYRFRGHWIGLEMTERERAFWPSMEQLPDFEPMASFVQLDGDRDHWGRPTDEWCDRLKELFEPTLESIRHTIRKLELDLVRKIPSSVGASSSVDDPNLVLELATSVFVVGRSKASTSLDVHVYFGREVLLAARDHATWLKDLPYNDPLPAQFSETGSSAVGHILEMCKLKPSTTILELDTRDAHFVCTACEPTIESPIGSSWGLKVKCRRVLSWRTAVEHACRVHARAHSRPMKLRFLNKSELAILSAKSYKKIEQYSSYNIKHTVPNCFTCNRCRRDDSEIPQKRRTAAYRGGLLTLKEVLKHLQKEHNITVGAAKENVDYWYHPRLRRGLMKSTMTDFRLIV